MFVALFRVKKKNFIFAHCGLKTKKNKQTCGTAIEDTS